MARTEQPWLGAGPVQLGRPAALPAPDPEHRGAAALALPEGRLDRPVRGGPGGAPRARRAGAVGDDGPAPDRGLAGGTCRLAGGGPGGPPPPLSPGGGGPPPPPPPP